MAFESLGSLMPDQSQTRRPEEFGADGTPGSQADTKKSAARAWLVVMLMVDLCVAVPGLIYVVLAPIGVVLPALIVLGGLTLVQAPLVWLATRNLAGDEADAGQTRCPRGT